MPTRHRGGSLSAGPPAGIHACEGGLPATGTPLPLLALACAADAMGASSSTTVGVTTGTLPLPLLLLLLLAGVLEGTAQGVVQRRVVSGGSCVWAVCTTQAQWTVQ